MLQGNGSCKNREISYLSSSNSEEEGLDPTEKTVKELDSFVAKIEKTWREARYAVVAKSLKEGSDKRNAKSKNAVLLGIRCIKREKNAERIKDKIIRDWGWQMRSKVFVEAFQVIECDVCTILLFVITCLYVMCCDWGRNYWMQNAWDAIHLTCAPVNPEYTEWVSEDNQSIPLMKRAKMMSMKWARYFFLEKRCQIFMLNSSHEITVISHDQDPTCPRSTFQVES